MAVLKCNLITLTNEHHGRHCCSWRLAADLCIYAEFVHRPSSSQQHTLFTENTADLRLSILFILCLEDDKWTVLAVNAVCLLYQLRDVELSAASVWSYITQVRRQNTTRCCTLPACMFLEMKQTGGIPLSHHTLLPSLHSNSSRHLLLLSLSSLTLSVTKIHQPNRKFVISPVVCVCSTFKMPSEQFGAVALLNLTVRRYWITCRVLDLLVCPFVQMEVESRLPGSWTDPVSSQLSGCGHYSLGWVSHKHPQHWEHLCSIQSCEHREAFGKLEPGSSQDPHHLSWRAAGREKEVNPERVMGNRNMSEHAEVPHTHSERCDYTHRDTVGTHCIQFNILSSINWGRTHWHSLMIKVN